MKQWNKWGAIAVLASGLCLVATDTFAVSYKLINSSGTTIQAKCSTDLSYTDITNGTTADISCSGTSVNVRVAGNTSGPDSLFRECRPGFTTELTVNMGSNGSLTYSPVCVLVDT